MEKISNVLQGFESDLRVKVIENVMNDLNFLDESTKQIIIEYTNRFSLQDTLMIDSNNPVLYAIVVREFLKEHNVDTEEDYNEQLNEAMSDNWWEFVDVLGEYARKNINKIKKGEGI
jgi:hemerythrin-like domain-containing protein